MQIGFVAGLISAVLIKGVCGPSLAQVLLNQFHSIFLI